MGNQIQSWRDFLTADEIAIIEAAVHAKARWENLNDERAMITKRT
jgi:antirestriction protein ArdC